MSTMNIDGSPKNIYQPNNPKRIDLNKVEDVTPNDYGLTPALLKTYMFGLNIIDPETKQKFSDTKMQYFIDEAVSNAEEKLGICILPRIIPDERHDYDGNEFKSMNFIQTYEHPILQLEDVSLMYNNTKLVTFPVEWWKIYPREGQIKAFPSIYNAAGGQGMVSNAIAQSVVGISGMNMLSIPGLYGGQDVPQVSSVTYVAGILPPHRRGMNRDFEMPATLLSLIAKYALRELLEIWGDLIIGAGIASQSINVDGISQSIDTVQSAMYTGGAARISLVNDTIGKLEDVLQNYYGTNGIVL